jgi:cob(I)alamin adenosyltransferase
MVHLTRIYTRLGDDGDTHLADMSRVPKTDSVIAALGDVAEANAALGLARAVGLATPLETIAARLAHEFFDIGADLATPLGAERSRATRVGEAWIATLEADCDALNANLAPLRSFVLPAGGIASAGLHWSAAIVRRAERGAWRAARHRGLDVPGGLNSFALRYLNRSSDLLFCMARAATPAGGEAVWIPPAERAAADLGVADRPGGVD